MSTWIKCKQGEQYTEQYKNNTVRRGVIDIGWKGELEEQISNSSQVPYILLHTKALGRRCESISSPPPAKGLYNLTDWVI